MSLCQCESRCWQRSSHSLTPPCCATGVIIDTTYPYWLELHTRFLNLTGNWTVNLAQLFGAFSTQLRRVAMAKAEPEARESNFYDSKCLTEYYDLYEEKNRESLDLKCDAPIYLGALQKNLTERSPPPSSSYPYVVLDIGTGTGRGLINLARDAAAQEIDLSNVEFIGVDKEPAMVE